MSAFFWGILIGWVGTSIGGAFFLAIVMGGNKKGASK